MAKLSAINKNKSRIKLSDKLYKKRQSLKKIIMNKIIFHLPDYNPSPIAFRRFFRDGNTAYI